MARLESNGIRTMRSINDMGYSSSKGTPIKRKEDVTDEIKKLSRILLEKLKEDTSISKSNHMIELVTHLDTDNIERLYFHVQNMRYGEYYTEQQDCYGRIDDKGIVEVFKSREPGEKKEAYSDYSQADKRKIEEFKRIMEEGLEAIKEEDKKWSDKSLFGKMTSKIKGEKHKSKKITRDFLLKLPEHLKEMKKDPTLADTLRVKPDDLIMDEHAASSPDIVHETSDKTH